MNIHPLQEMPGAFAASDMKNLITLHEQNADAKVSYFSQFPETSSFYFSCLEEISAKGLFFIFGCEWEKGKDKPSTFFNNFTQVKEVDWRESIYKELQGSIGLTSLECNVFIDCLLEDFYSTKELLLSESQSSLMYISTRRKRTEAWHRDSFLYAGVKNYIGASTLYGLPDSFEETSHYHFPQLKENVNVFQLQGQGMVLHKGGSVKQPHRGMAHKSPNAEEGVHRITQLFLVNEIVT